MADGGAGRPETATVLFTDVVASTALRQRVGDDAADELRRAHDRVLRDALAEHGGHEVKGTGDGLMIVFGSAVAAVAAAEAMQQGMARLSRRAPTPIEIRVGVSAGDVVWEGDDCFGTPVVEANRLCGHAQPGEIIVSDVVRLLAGSRGLHEFRAVGGALELKGLSEAVAAAQVVWRDDGEGRVPLPAGLTVTSSVDLVGRVGELDELWTAWKQVRTGERRTVLVSGEPGVGKTRLAAEVARRAYEEGATVLFGRCDEDLAVPYQPFVEALRDYVLAAPLDDLVEQVGPYGGDLARLVPQLGTRVRELPEPLNADPETERYRLFEAVTTLLDGIAAASPVLLVLEDLHWGAKPTLLLLRHLSRARADVPLLVVGTYRDTELDRRHPLAEVLADLRREGATERVALRGLDESEVTEFVRVAADQTLDDEIVELARAVHAETEGNPFFVGQMLRHLVESGAVTQVDGRWRRGADVAGAGLPEGVREVIGRRLSALDDQTNRMLSTAAVIGREFDVGLLAETTDLDREQVFDSLELAEAARLVEATPTHGGYTFVHALVRTTLYDEIPTTRRLRTHRRVAAALEPRAERGDDALLPQLARHYCEAAALGEVDKAIEYATAAAERALDRLAYEEAGDLYERALGVLEPGSAEERDQRCRLLIALARARLSAGNRTEGHRAAYAAADEAQATNQPDLLGEALLAIGGVRGWSEAGLVDEGLIGLAEAVLASIPTEDSRLRSCVTARLAGELYFDPSAHDRRRALTEEALAMARRLDDAETTAYVLSCAHWGMWVPGNVRDRLAVADEIVRLGRAAANRELEFGGLAWRFIDLIELGETARADEALAAERAIAEELRQPEYSWYVGVHTAARLMMTGRFDEAAAVAEQALADGQEAHTETAFQMYGVVQLELANARGGLEALEPVLLSMVEQYPLIPAWRSGLVYVYGLLGREDDLRPHLDVLADDDFATLPFDANWPAGMVSLVVACALVCDRARLEVLYERLLPLRDTCITAGMPALHMGSCETVLALAAVALGRDIDADEHLARGLESNLRADSPTWNVYTKFNIARVLLRREEGFDRDRLTQLLRDCVTDGADLGTTRIVDAAREMADAHRIDLAPAR